MIIKLNENAEYVSICFITQVDFLKTLGTFIEFYLVGLSVKYYNHLDPWFYMCNLKYFKVFF